MSQTTHPKVAVLLAAYNGEKWIEEQIDSILNQKNVQITLFINIDKSSDNTVSIINNYLNKCENVKLCNTNKQFGSAGKNFYDLIKNVDVECFDFISFSDQDDIWNSDKLSRAIRLLTLNKCDAYSSDVTAIWSDGTTKYIKKSNSQKLFDHYFQSGGPGCTYVLTQTSYKSLQSFVRNNFELTSSIELHDWFIYFYYRFNNLKWYIDSYSSLLYRQHNNNEFGANTGGRAFLTRVRKFYSGWMFSEVTKLINIFNINEYNNYQFIKLIIMSPFQCRRRKSEAIFLWILTTIFFLKKSF